MLDGEALLTATTESPPCGPNLEHDLVFFELEQAARGKPEQVVGNAVKPGEDPKWPRVVELGQTLLGRTKDLRVAVHLTRGLTHTDGIPGLAAGLGLISGLLDRYWEQLHPLLEADRDGDPTERLNALAPLADPEAAIRDLRDANLVSSRQHGQLQARDVEAALGRLPGRSASRPLGEIHALIAAAFADDRAIPAALGEARARLGAIELLISDRVTIAHALDLKPLAQCLDNLLEACDGALGTATGGARTDAGGSAAHAPAEASRTVGGIGSREDALRALDLVCAYLERQEPSNPAPLLIRRAQRLMQKNFVEIVRDLMPDSISQLERLAGELENK
jgi:type VI secretion system protein ImpA